MAKTERKKEYPGFLNKIVDKKGLSNLLADVYENFGNATTARLANNLKNLGFSYATKASVTISIEDLAVPPKKVELVKEAEDELRVTTDRFERGEITEVERYNKVIDTWSETNEKITEAVVENFDRLNPVYMMAFSGARGNISQVRQLVGMRGLMADSEGKIIDLPIKSNFREGLSVTEYVISAYGARKGLVDTALKTADSGYLTRRLVDVAQDVIIREEDCGTEKYVDMGPLMDGDKIAIGLGSRVIGRVVIEDVKDDEGNVIVKKDDIVDRSAAAKIDKTSLRAIKIRSVLACESKYGVCKKCYGWSTTDNKPADMGEAIGIIAAQSIGEPGTQLTMRTFHTGGAVAGSGKTRATYTAPAAGEVSYSMPTKEARTKYGDVVFTTEKAGKLKVGSKSLDIALGTSLTVQDGDTVKEGQYLGDVPELGKKKILTEKASKDVITTISGVAQFTDFGVDETTDRQGNISKLANKQGTIWVHSGEVLPLAQSGSVIVENAKSVKKGDTLAETTIACEYGGEVRYGADVLVEKTKVGSRELNKLVRGRLVNVINASVGGSDSWVEQFQQGNYWIHGDVKSKTPIEKYVLKVVNGELIENGKILAELTEDEETPRVACSGEVRFDGLEIDERKIVTKHGRVIFIPEEMHVLSKDASLVNVKSGDSVKAGTELVKDVYATIDGIAKVSIENNIVHEVTITPGELHDIGDISELKFQDGDIVKKGVEVAPGLKTKGPSMVSLFVDEETGETKLLLREVQIFEITPRQVKFEAETTDGDIGILPITQMNFKDGDKVRNINGATLTKTSLILYSQGNYKEAKGLVEVEDDSLNIIFQENIILRSDRRSSSLTEVLVNPGDYIEPGAAIAKIQTISMSDGEVFISEEDKSKILITTVNDVYELECSAAPKVKKGDYIREGDELDKSTRVEESGCVLDVKGKTLVVRKARPYLVSFGTRLHLDNNSLVQQGDQIATIIYERIKTGDIVQGLPKVEELLEGRKPKEPAIISDIEGNAEVIADEVGEKLFIQNKGGERKEFVIPPGQNIVVANGEEIKIGDVLTDGQPTPHEILQYKGVDAVQEFLVDEVQSVYNSQGVEIANKHLEVIVRQMTRKVKVEDPGDTELLQGEMHDLNYFNQINEAVKAEGKVPAACEHVLLGLTKASLNTESFISAASFQETTRILAEASMKGKEDWLHGLKENIIIGRLVPSGTGFDHDVDGEAALLEAAAQRQEVGEISTTA